MHVDQPDVRTLDHTEPTTPQYLTVEEFPHWVDHAAGVAMPTRCACAVD